MSAKKTIFATMIVLVLTSMFTIAATPAATGHGDDDITFCHATGAGTWVKLTTSKLAFYIAGHPNHSGDIVPPFSQIGPDFPGMNWDQEGQAIFENGCKTPEPTYCEQTVALEPQVEYGPWSEWVWNGETGQFERSRTVTTTIVFVDAEHQDHRCGRRVKEEVEKDTHPDACPNLEGGQFEVPDGYIKPGRLCLPKPVKLETVKVGVSMSCGPEAGDGVVYQTYIDITVDPSGGATLSINGDDYTASTTIYGGFQTYPWSAQAADGFVISGVGKATTSGSVKLSSSDCNGSSPPPVKTFDSGGPADALPLALAGLSVLSLLGAGGLFVRRRR